MKQTGSIIAIIVLLIVAYFLFFQGDTWLGHYYPDRTDLTKSIRSPEFTSLEECRAWVENQVPIYNLTREGYDYECGKNCRFEKDYGIYVCAETLR